jgi:heat shock protein HslJ
MAAAAAVATMLVMASACGMTPAGDDPATPSADGAPQDATPPAGGPSPGSAGATPPGREPGRPPADPAPLLDGTRWTVETVIVDGAANPVPASPSVSAWLAFEGGRFIAGTGCGEVEGRVQVSEGQLRFSDVVHAIPVHCPEEFAQADRVMRELLDREATFALAGGQLRLDHPSGIGLRLRAEGPA